MRLEMENHLRQFGALPAGLRLETAELYRNATGQGEIWLDASGLPARLTTQLTLPPHGASGKITAEVTTDFSNFDQAQAGPAGTSFWSQPLVWLDGRLPQRPIQNQLAPQADIVNTVNGEGAVWAVTASTLPLNPGETLTLTLGDAYYVASASKLTLPVPANLPVFAQVDSASSLANYGAVWERHERNNQPYNNILETRSD
jgi:hypothetical protein